MCFIKNRERGSNEFSDCTVREFSKVQMKVAESGSVNIPGLVFLYIFIGVILAFVSILCCVTMSTDEYDEVNLSGFFCCGNNNDNDHFN